MTIPPQSSYYVFDLVGQLLMDMTIGKVYFEAMHKEPAWHGVEVVLGTLTRSAMQPTCAGFVSCVVSAMASLETRYCTFKTH